MPLPQYTWMHRGSKPSQGDVEILCEALRRLITGHGGSGKHEVHQNGGTE